MPPLTDYNSNLDLDHKILLWQSCAGPYPGHRWHKSRTCSMREVPCHQMSDNGDTVADKQRRSTSLK